MKNLNSMKSRKIYITAFFESLDRLNLFQTENIAMMQGNYA
jgi:hypothetical protein